MAAVTAVAEKVITAVEDSETAEVATAEVATAEVATISAATLVDRK